MKIEEKITHDNREKMALEASILSTSSSMLGFCFVVITYLHATGITHNTIIDELTMVALLAFMVNCFLSFLSVRNVKFQNQKYINITSGMYLLGMLILFGIVVLIAFDLTGSIKPNS